MSRHQPPRSSNPRRALPGRSAALACAAGAAALLVALLVSAASPTPPLSVQDQVDALLARSDDELESEPRRALATARRAFGIAREAGDVALMREAEIRACDITAVIDAPAAMAAADAGLAQARKEQNGRAQAGFHSCRGYALDLQGRPGEAALEFEAAVLAAERAESRLALADALALRGESRHYHGRYDDAIADLNRAYALNRELGLKSGQRYALNAIANVYSDANVGEYDKAIGYYRQLLKQAEADGLRSAAATARFNIASALEMRGEYDAALVEYRRALEIETEVGDRLALADTERAIGALLTRQGKPEEGLPWIGRALDHFVATGDAENIARTRMARAHAMRGLGRVREAVIDLEFAERHFRTNNNPRQLAKVYEALAEARAAIGDWRRAYEASMAFRAAQHELEKRAREEQTTRLRVQFDTTKKEQENRALLIENAHRGEALRNAERMRSLQRLMILLGTALLLLLGAMALQLVHRGRRLRALAMTDELTGLPNRRHILEFLDRELRAARAAGKPLSLIAFDIDHFKRINDLHGHLGGDRVLRAVGEIVARALPAGARVGRMGGEEFLAVLPEVVASDAHGVAEALRSAVSGHPFDGFRADERVTISVGVAAAADEDDIEALLRRADDAMYRAKHEGRDRVVAG